MGLHLRKIISIFAIKSQNILYLKESIWAAFAELFPKMIA